MKTKIYLTFALVCSGLTLNAADPATPAARLTGEITPKLYFFDYFDGVGADRTSFLERYRAQRGIGQDSRSGFYLDLDLKLKYQINDDQALTVKRWGEGQYRHGGHVQWDSEQLRWSADYSFFRRSTGGLDYLFSPNQVPGGTDPSYFYPAQTNTSSGYVAKFNDDAGRFLYHVNRLAYGLGFTIKPGVLGEKTTLSVNYTGYLRYGQRLQTYALGGSDAQSTVAGDRSFVLQRWRGFSRNVDENMNRLDWTIAASPKDLFNFTYQGAWEKYDNRARDYSHADIPLAAPYFYNLTADKTRPLGFIPDSTLTTHQLRVNKALGVVNVAAGYGLSSLQQDSFSQPQVTLGYTKGEINTENAFLDLNATLSPAIGIQGFLKYGLRENDSSFPVTNLIDTVTAEKLGVRLNRLESVRYGLGLTLRPAGLGSTFALGWRAEDKSRDLTFHNTGIIQSVSLYRNDTANDEVYAKWSSHNMKGVTFHVTSTYATADKTGLVTEPGQAFGLKAVANYTAPSGLVVSGYYSLKDTQNDNHAFTDKAVTSPAVSTQDISRTVQSAGTSFSYQPAKQANIYASLDWMSMDASVLFFESSRRRFESTTTFGLRDLQGSVVDNYLFSVGGDYQASDRLKWSGSYTLTSVKGHLANNTVAAQLTAIDDTLDSLLHTAVIEAAYDLTKTKKLRVSYRYDQYEDSAYPLLSGGTHSVMVGLTFML
jgi:hypothetical protein